MRAGFVRQCSATPNEIRECIQGGIGIQWRGPLEQGKGERRGGWRQGLYVGSRFGCGVIKKCISQGVG